MATSTLTIRVAPELAERLRFVAAERGISLNTFASLVLAAAVDPDLAGDDVERVRERLALAGLLADAPPAPAPPDPRRLARARARAASGRPLSELVAEDRG